MIAQGELAPAKEDHQDEELRKWLFESLDNDIKKKNYKCPSNDKIQILENIALKEVERAIEKIRCKEIYKPKDKSYLEPLPYGDLRDKLTWWFIPKLMTFSKFK